MPQRTIHSVGHGARPVAGLLEILLGAGVRRLVDVRTAPGSRRHPQFGRDALAGSLGAAGIEYVWRRELGGWRRARRGSPHVALRSPGFRGYADHMASDDFRAALEWLSATSEAVPTAFMCAESMWWRCHRRLLADALTVLGWKVLHLMPDRRVQAHGLHPAARLLDGRLIYDRPQPEQGTLGG